MVTYLKEIVYGGNDGIVTTFAIVAGFSGAQHDPATALPAFTVLLFGFSNLFSDGVSMALGNFLSNRSDVNPTNNKGIRTAPLFTSLATFISFISFGFVPLTPYIFWQEKANFKMSIVATLLALISLGIVRWKAGHENVVRSVGEIVLLGGVAAVVAYMVGAMFDGI
jgi:VIT1/CCC1 family predicted Fe2+/Mn2+ transporter